MLTKSVWRRCAGVAVIAAVVCLIIGAASLPLAARAPQASRAPYSTSVLDWAPPPDTGVAAGAADAGQAPPEQGDLVALEAELAALKERVAALDGADSAYEAVTHAQQAAKEAAESAQATKSLLEDVKSYLKELSAAEGDTQEIMPIQDGAIPGLGKANFPVIDGSTACQPLITALYMAACGVDAETAEAAVSTNGTSAAWKGVDPSAGNASADIILAYEPEGGVPENGVESVPIGRDGLVFITGKNNTVKSLAADQLRGIYAGRITDWSEVGGAAQPIMAYQRNTDSGSHAMLLKCLMQGETLADPPSEMVAGSMDYMLSLLDFDAAGDSLGYSVYYYADKMYEAPNVKMLAVDGVAPSNKTIADGSYPLTSDFYLAIRKDAGKNAPARLLYDWLRTPEGAALLEECGYVPVAQDATAPATEVGSAADGQSGRIDIPPEVAEAAASAAPVKGAHPEWLFQINRPSDILSSTYSYSLFSTIVNHEGDVVMSGNSLSIIQGTDGATAIAQQKLFEQTDESGTVNYKEGETNYVFKSRLYSVKGKLLVDWEEVSYENGPGRFVMVQEYKNNNRVFTLLDPITMTRPNTGDLGYTLPMISSEFNFVKAEDGGFYARLATPNGGREGAIIKFDKNANPIPPAEGESYDDSIMSNSTAYTEKEEGQAEDPVYKAASNMGDGLYCIPTMDLPGFGHAIYFDDAAPRYILQEQPKAGFEPIGVEEAYNLYNMSGELMAEGIRFILPLEYECLAPDRLLVVKDGYHGLMDPGGNWVYKESIFKALAD
ncbi:MAG: substrate-binding domain-containing protein [Clostridiales Family XIII bacterium]|jgi:phosphate transport system substrate-binding protein|nr:substrate-binding domain-containing protein [Clostridiales Family XIII bacterium]